MPPRKKPSGPPGDPIMRAQRQKDGIYCSICWEDFDEPVVLGECGHTFCRECLTPDGFNWMPEWITNVKCPTCAHVTKTHPRANFALIDFLRAETERRKKLDQKEKDLIMFETVLNARENFLNEKKKDLENKAVQQGNTTATASLGLNLTLSQSVLPAPMQCGTTRSRRWANDRTAQPTPSTTNDFKYPSPRMNGSSTMGGSEAIQVDSQESDGVELVGVAGSPLHGGRAVARPGYPDKRIAEPIEDSDLSDWSDKENVGSTKQLDILPPGPTTPLEQWDDQESICDVDPAEWWLPSDFVAPDMEAEAIETAIQRSLEDVGDAADPTLGMDV